MAQNCKESNNNLLASNPSQLAGFYFTLCIYMFDFCDYSSTGKVFYEQRGLTSGLKYWLIWS